MPPELDLQQTIRPGLDILANEIVIALKKRTRFRQNPEIYVPGLVRDDPGTSLLAYVLGEVERVHAALGRYTFADQEAFTDVSGVAPIIDREPPASPVHRVRSAVDQRIIDFYLEWIRRSCAAGSNPDTYGETVTADVNALLGIMERVNLGKLVAEYKFSRNPAAFRDTGGERERILPLIVHPERESQVHALARRLAAHYDTDADEAERVFRWMISTTVDIEVDYIRRRIAAGD